MLLVILFFGVLGVAFKLLTRNVRRSNRSKWRRDGGRNWRSDNVSRFTPRHDPVGSKVPDAAEQLRIVMASDFHAQSLLNKSEKRLFEALDKLVIELAPPGWQVMAQVSLGEILKSPSKDAYLAVNSKRVDLLIVDADAKAVAAVEYQGGGHFKGAHATAARDAVKKEALRRAGIGYVEVVGGEMNAAELRRVVEKIVGPAVTSRSA